MIYQKGFTIAGAKQQLKERSKRKQALLEEDSKILGSHKTTLEHTVNTPQPTREELEQQIVDLQKKLLKLRELL